MKKVRIGLPDGNGCFGTLEFWKQYFSDIGVEYVGVDDEEYLARHILHNVFCLSPHISS